MTLPKAKKRKIISEKEFVEIARKVKESFKEQAEYLDQRKLKHGDTISSHIDLSF